MAHHAEWRVLTTRGKEGARSRHGHTACVLGGRMHVYAGRSADEETPGHRYLDDIIVLDPSSLAWKAVRTKGQRPPARVFHSANTLGDNRMVAFGGASPAEGSAEGASQPAVAYLNDVWLYKADASSWDRCTVAGTPPAGRSSHAAVLVPGPRPQLIVHGGTNGERAFNDVWLMTLSAPRWELLETSGAKPNPRCYHVCALRCDISPHLPKVSLTFHGLLSR